MGAKNSTPISPPTETPTETPITETAKTSKEIPSVVAYPEPNFQGTPVYYSKTGTIEKPTVPIKSLEIPAGVRVEIQNAGFAVPLIKDGPDRLNSISGTVFSITITKLSNSNLQAVQKEGIWLLLFLLFFILLLVFLFKRSSSSTFP